MLSYLKSSVLNHTWHYVKMTSQTI